jgi:enoyl-CoA hydratase/carnithine racemase
MTEAIFGLIGVVVGGVIQGGGTWLLARRGDRQVARGAARMTAGELIRAANRMNEVVESGVLGDHAVHTLDLTRWHEHEPLFAATITDDETWFDIYNGHRYCEHVNDWADRARAKPTTHLNDQQRDEIDRASHLALRGAAALMAIGMYGPAKWSVRRGLFRLRSLRPMSEEAFEADLARRRDPRVELPSDDDPSSR